MISGQGKKSLHANCGIQYNTQEKYTRLFVARQAEAEAVMKNPPDPHLHPFSLEIREDHLLCQPLNMSVV